MRKRNKKDTTPVVDTRQNIYECVVGTRMQQRSNDETAIYDLCSRLGRSTSGKQVYFLEYAPGVKKPTLLYTWKDGKRMTGIGINNAK